MEKLSLNPELFILIAALCFCLENMQFGDEKVPEKAAQQFSAESIHHTSFRSHKNVPLWNHSQQDV